MSRSRNSFLAALTLLLIGLFAATALAGDGAIPTPGGPDDPKGAPADSKKSAVKLRLKGLRDGKLPVGEQVKAVGTLRPFVKGERVSLVLYRGSKAIDRKIVTVEPNGKKSVGEFSFGDKLVQPGRYSVQAVHNPTKALQGSKTRSKKFQIRYPDVDPGEASDEVRLFNNLLRKIGYVPGTGESYNGPTQRAVLAFRKVNNMSRVTDATGGIFKTIAAGKGSYRIQHPEDGRHVETDLSRQVMVLADGDKAEEIYHISSGAPATPTVTGRFLFYAYQPGFNDKGMYYSVYFHRGYAIHGYPSVPNYPASHGCLRNPIPNSVHIYNWVDIGMPIWVYH